MLGMMFLLRTFSNFTLPGQVIKVATSAAKFGESFIDKAELELLVDNQSKGILDAEERFSERVHGTVEPLLPAEVRLEELPKGFEKAVGHRVCGEVLWKISEWNDFWRWVEVLLHNSHSQEKIRLGRDGLWLVEIGRQRWADVKMRDAAFATGAKYKEIWEPIGMWKKQSS